MKNLNRICEETGAYVVITSYWRLTKTINEMQKNLEDFGFTGKVIGKTSKTQLGSRYEINLYYFNNKDIFDYIIIDSNDIDTYKSQIKIDFNGKGLTKEDAQKAIDLLNEKGNK